MEFVFEMVSTLKASILTNLSQGYGDDGGDDGIVPSTPTLFVPRRTDGFGEAVSSPQVPSAGRFTFSESNPPAVRAGKSHD